MARHQSGPGRHIPPAPRERHEVRTRSTHGSSGYEEPLVAAQPAQQREAQVDHLFGEQDLMNGAVTFAKMRLQDEFSTTVLTPAGPFGSWEGYLITGVFNGSFADNKANSNAPVGRTLWAPYWELLREIGTPTFITDVGVLSITYSAVGDRGTFISDKIRVRQGVPLSFFICDYNSAGGTVSRTFKVHEYPEGSTTANDIWTVRTDSSLGTFNAQRGRARPTNMIIPVSGKNLSQSTTHVRIEIETDCVSGTPTYVCTEVGIIPNSHFTYDTMPTVDGLEHDALDGWPIYNSSKGLWFYYDRTNDIWLSTEIFTAALGSGAAGFAASATTANIAWTPMPLHGGDDLWIVDVVGYFFVNTGGSALSGSHSWELDFQKGIESSTSFTSIAQTIVNSGSNGNRRVTTAVGALMNGATAHAGLRMNIAKVGTPGNAFCSGNVRYRVVLNT